MPETTAAAPRTGVADILDLLPVAAVVIDAAGKVRAVNALLADRVGAAQPGRTLEQLQRVLGGHAALRCGPADGAGLRLCLLDATTVLPDEATAASAGDDWLVADARSRALKALATRVAASDVTVLIQGPSGAGKEVIARHIHRRSARADGPFVAINCAAIPETMLEALLFGYEKGAFTGAQYATPGKFELAQGGTLLLDEISEMAPALQAKLLRVLQEREVERLGSRRTIRLDVRVIATTNRALAEEVRGRRFREDLYYRLAVFPLEVAPLAARADDIVPLARHFLARHAQAWGHAAELGAEAEAALGAHPWPGNVRELDNVIQRALVMAGGGRVDALHLGLEPVAVTPAADPVADIEADLAGALREHESARIRAALASGSRREAAERLGISERTLRYKLARLRGQGLDPAGPETALQGPERAVRRNPVMSGA